MSRFDRFALGEQMSVTFFIAHLRGPEIKALLWLRGVGDRDGDFLFRLQGLGKRDH